MSGATLPTFIHCPACTAEHAYSAALLGRTVRCRHCRHEFAVTAPPGEAALVPVEAAVASGPPTPPPLPTRSSRRPEPRPERPRRSGDEDDRPARVAAPPRRSSGVAALLGLLGLFLVGSVVLALGIGYLLWPRPDQGPKPDVQTAAPPVEAPTAIEQPKGLDDLLKDAPKKGGGNPAVGQPAVPRVEPKFPNPVPPAFTRLDPLPIKPTPLTGDRQEVDLRGRAGQVVPAGGGRLLLIHIPSRKTVAVFDVNEGKVVKEVSAEEEVFLAGGMNVFVVYRPKQNMAERWSCKTLRKDGEHRGLFPGPVRALGMGSASNGPLVAAVGGPRQTPFGGATLVYFNPIGFQEIPYPVAVVREEVEKRAGLGSVEQPAATVRVSAAGTLVTGWGLEAKGRTGLCDVLANGRITRHWQTRVYPCLLPSPDGKVVFGAGGMLGPDQALAAAQLAPDGDAWSLPPVNGGGRLVVRNPGQATCSIDVYLAGQDRVAQTIPNQSGLPAPKAPATEATAVLDQCVIWVPDAKLLVLIPGDRDKLVLRRVTAGEPKK